MLPPVYIHDDFLDPALLRAIRAYALEHESAFEPATVGRKELDATYRNSLQLPQKLGPLKAPFVASLEAALPAIFAGCGVPPFEVCRYAEQVAAHGDGGFYKPHIDTRSEDYRKEASDRLVSAVFYFHVEPARFTGGELVMHPFAPGPEPRRIEARGNRLVAFSSVAPHEVLPVSVGSGAFADSRFSINCWLNRARATT